jgi:hypothetical protein
MLRERAMFLQPLFVIPAPLLITPLYSMRITFLRLCATAVAKHLKMPDALPRRGWHRAHSNSRTSGERKVSARVHFHSAGSVHCQNCNERQHFNQRLFIVQESTLTAIT